MVMTFSVAPYVVAITRCEQRKRSFLQPSDTRSRSCDIESHLRLHRGERPDKAGCHHTRSRSDADAPDLLPEGRVTPMGLAPNLTRERMFMRQDMRRVACESPTLGEHCGRPRLLSKAVGKRAQERNEGVFLGGRQSVRFDEASTWSAVYVAQGRNLLLSAVRGGKTAILAVDAQG
jgi:hypothetical protein